MIHLRQRFRIGQAVEIWGRAGGVVGTPGRVVAFSPGGHYVHISSTITSGAMAYNASEARKAIRVPGERPENLITPGEDKLLARVRETGGLFLHGGTEVRQARRMLALGLVGLVDNGAVRATTGNRLDNGERWWCTPVRP